MEYEARTEGIATHSVRTAAITAVRAARIAENDVIRQGRRHLMATCKGAPAGAEAIVASIKDAKPRAQAAQNARMEFAAVAIRSEQNEADAAGAATKAAIARINMGQASNGAVAINNNMDRTIARAQIGYPLINRLSLIHI